MSNTVNYDHAQWIEQYQQSPAGQIEQIVEQLSDSFYKQDSLAHHRALELLNELRSEIEYKEKG